MKVEISEKDQALILWCSLPLSYAHFVVTLIYELNSVSIEIVKLLLNLSEMRKRIMEENNTGHSRGEILVVRGRSL